MLDGRSKEGGSSSITTTLAAACGPACRALCIPGHHGKEDCSKDFCQLTAAPKLGPISCAEGSKPPAL